MDLIQKAVEASTIFEQTNTDLKKAYLLKYIDLYNSIVSDLPSFKGAFGTGYPFYALGKNLQGKLPIIEEQLRYNNELLKSMQNYVAKKRCCENCDSNWPCESCLEENCKEMPDLKKVCKKCPVTPKQLKPRKVINRLPDIDLWMVVEDGYEDITKKKLIELFEKYNLHTSDVDPIKTINEVYQISTELKNGIMPTKHIPLDSHIITHSELYSLINMVLPTMIKATEEHKIPYLPILPESLRKKWQHDDEAYNFIHDFLYALTEYEFESDLRDSLRRTRRSLVQAYDNDELEKIAIITGAEPVKRRQQEPVLRLRFKERVNLWKEL